MGEDLRNALTDHSVWLARTELLLELEHRFGAPELDDEAVEQLETPAQVLQRVMAGLGDGAQEQDIRNFIVEFVARWMKRPPCEDVLSQSFVRLLYVSEP